MPLIYGKIKGIRYLFPQFAGFPDIVNNKDIMVASHMVIEKAISLFGKDYRYEDKNHPIEELRDRKKDNTSVGRI